MKKLFEIDESEKSRILEMHLNATKRNYLKEQEDETGVNNNLEQTPTKKTSTIEPFCKNYYCVNSRCSKELEDANLIVQNNSTLNGQQVVQLPILGRGLVDRSKFKAMGTEGQKGTVAYEAKRITSEVIIPEMTTSTENWRKLNDACKSGDNAACCAIGKLSAQIINTKGTIKGEKDKWGACVITSANQLQPETGASKTKKIKLKPPIPFNQIFDNNSPIIKQEMKDSLSNYLDRAIEQYGNVLTVTDITIDTSSSRFRNTGDYSNKTFKQLSEDRTNSAYKFITEMLTEKGFKFSNFTPVLNSNGGNGDGSSGPNPPEGYNYVDGGEVTMNTQPPKQPRDEFGAPLSNPEDYEKFKYCIIDITVEVPEKTLPGGPGKWELQYFFYIYERNTENNEPMFLRNKLYKIIQNIVK
jgi:hypothetical protein